MKIADELVYKTKEWHITDHISTRVGFRVSYRHGLDILELRLLNLNKYGHIVSYCMLDITLLGVTFNWYIHRKD